MSKRLGEIAIAIFSAALVLGLLPMYLAITAVDHYRDLGQSVPPSVWTHFYVVAGITLSGPAVFIAYAAFCLVAWVAMGVHKLLWHR